MNTEQTTVETVVAAAPKAAPKTKKTAPAASKAAPAAPKTSTAAPKLQIGAATGSKARILQLIQDAKDGISQEEIAKALNWVRCGSTISKTLKISPFKVRKERIDGTLRYFKEA